MNHTEQPPLLRESLEWIVAREDAGARLDKFLAGQLADASRAAVQKWIGEGRVTVDGAPAPSSLRLAAGQIVVARPPAPERTELSPEDIPLRVIYEDEHLVVIDKPAGMVVHPAAGVRAGTLVNALLYRYPELADMAAVDEAEDEDGAGQPARPGIVHRLDKDTSGVLVAARSAAARAALQAQFGARTVQKVYLALVHDIPTSPEGLIRAPIGRDRRQRKRMAVVRDGRPALSEYRVLETYGQYALLEVTIHTGRTHQIRVHMAFIGHPVVGDTVYGRRKKAQLACPRQFLHAWRIAFTHPVTDERLECVAPLPADLQAVLDRLAGDANLPEQA
jgi:23S rRNA pseudouridine1911/1915/1917 synthase